MRKIIEDIIYERDSKLIFLPLKFVLGILEIFYSFITYTRNILYDKNILPVKDVPCRVISIGNLTLGGTGKTPLVIYTAKLLKESGASVVVISRGYKSGIKKPVIVSDGENVYKGDNFPGDEPLLIANSVKDVPVIAGINRFKAAELAYEKFRPDIIILDDAFQHRKLYRDIDIVTIDAVTLIGNEHLLPRGSLRESPYGIRRAEAVVVTRFLDDLRRDKIERTIKYHERNIDIFFSKMIPAHLRKVNTSEKIGLDYLKGTKVFVLSNIAHPEQFHKMIESLGAGIVNKKIMPDHYRYGSAEIGEIEDNAFKSGAEKILMTSKDEFNLPNSGIPEKIEKLVLEIEISFENVETYMNLIYKKRV